MKSRNIGILIAARSDSSRLPKKHFKIINDNFNLSAIDYCIKRLKKTKIKKIFLCTTKRKVDTVFKNICKKNKIKLFKGSTSNVLKRYINCAKKNNIKDIIRITGDCPLIDINLIKKLLNIYIYKNYDYVSNTAPSSFPDGLDVEIVKLSALERSYLLNRSQKNLEHVTFFIKKSKKFKKFNLKYKKNLSNIRWTLDTHKDLILIKSIVNHFHPKIHFSWIDIEKVKKFNRKEI